MFNLRKSKNHYKLKDLYVCTISLAVVEETITDDFVDYAVHWKFKGSVIKVLYGTHPEKKLFDPLTNTSYISKNKLDVLKKDRVCYSVLEKLSDHEIHFDNDYLTLTEIQYLTDKITMENSLKL